MAALRTDWPTLLERAEATQDVREAVRAADVVCTATSSSTPVFADEDVRPGTHINGVGSFKPTMQEVPTETVARALVVVDQMEPALEEAGDLIVPLHDGAITEDHLSREIGQLLLETVTGRSSDEQVTFFKSVGNAVQDMAVGRHAYDEAERQGMGQVVALT
jgi:ornithine cyclodeaminase